MASADPFSHVCPLLDQRTMAKQACGPDHSDGRDLLNEIDVRCSPIEGELGFAPSPKKY